MLVSNQFTHRRARCEASGEALKSDMGHGSNIFHPVAKPRASEACILYIKRRTICNNVSQQSIHMGTSPSQMRSGAERLARCSNQTWDMGLIYFTPWLRHGQAKLVLRGKRFVIMLVSNQFTRERAGTSPSQMRSGAERLARRSNQTWDMGLIYFTPWRSHGQAKLVLYIKRGMICNNMSQQSIHMRTSPSQM
jgi:hypothetical protein